MQSRNRAFKRGHLDAAGYIPRHKTTKNRKGQRWYMQTIVLHETASDANQKCIKTLLHINPKAV